MCVVCTCDAIYTLINYNSQNKISLLYSCKINHSASCLLQPTNESKDGTDIPWMRVGCKQ
uniref:Uncharacterized protein n=1 Tax=Octopus bimaculoides TaxID=37653 RepID=A0A0L8G380_OCTBM